MIADLKPYPGYRESGLPWLGKCPAHWKQRRTKTLFQERVQKGFPNEPLLAATQTKGVVKKADYGSRTVTASKDLHLLKLVEVGDYVISLRSFQGGIEYAHCRGIISPAYTVLKPTKAAATGYYSHFFKSKPFIDSLTLFVTGIREGQNIDYERLSRAELPLPPEDEQVAIVRFLDHANRKIDRFIRVKRKMIALLNEQKQAIIQQSVTQGTNSEWRHLPVRAVLRPVKRVGFPDKTLLSLFRDFGVVPKDSRENKNVDVRDLALCQLVKPGDVVMNKMKAWQGSIAVSSLEGIVSPDYMVLEFICDGVVHKFFHYLLRSPDMVAEYRRRAYGVRPGQWRLMFPDFCRLHMSVPPIHEQERIVAHVEVATADLERLITRTEREIALMQEYRTRLTADIVTGKLDVREAAAKLPDTTDFTDSLGTDIDDTDNDTEEEEFDAETSAE